MFDLDTVPIIMQSVHYDLPIITFALFSFNYFNPENIEMYKRHICISKA